jgi:predicted TIM-barrel fold metal-dependent hydrolase
MQPASYPHPNIREDWLDMVKEDILESYLPIIDPHHHLWDRGNKHASGQYLLDELMADIGTGHKIVATVYVQAGWKLGNGGPPAFRPVSETAAANEVAVASEARNGRTRACAGIVSYADLRLEELDAVLDAHFAAGGGHFRGIRQSAPLDDAIVPMTTVTPPPGLVKDRDFQRGLRLLGTRGLTFDAWLYHPQLSDLVAAVSAAPQTRIVVDHLGGPLRCGPFRDRGDDVYRLWLKGMKALSEHPNVYVKLGGLGMTINGFDYHEEPRSPSSRRLASDWKSWVEPCIELLGAERCMFESNFPVDKGMFSYHVLWNAFKTLVAGASASEKAALFHDTAARVYNL